MAKAQRPLKAVLRSIPIRLRHKPTTAWILKHDFKYSKSSIHLAAKLVGPASALGVLHVKLNISGGQNPKVVDSQNGGSLELSSARKIGYATYLSTGRSLLIINDSADSESDPQADRVSLIVVSPAKIERMPDLKPESGSSRELDSLRKVVEELREEIRGLRDQPQSRSLQGAGKSARPASPNGRRNIDQELLRLDVKEAALDEAAAREAYFAARQTKENVAASQAELAELLAAWQKTKLSLLQAMAGERLYGERLDSATVPVDSEADDSASAVEADKQIVSFNYTNAPWNMVLKAFAKATETELRLPTMCRLRHSAARIRNGTPAPKR